MMSLKGICRCCLSEGNFKSMEYAPPPSCNQSYAEMLSDIWGYPLYNTGEVQLICGTCSTKLRQAVAFCKQVQAAEKAFVASLQQQTSEIKQEWLDDDIIMIIPDEKIEIIIDDCLPKSIASESSSLLLEKSELPPQKDGSPILQEPLQKSDDIHHKISSLHSEDETKNMVLAEISGTLLEKKENVYCQKCEEHFPHTSSYKRHVLVCNRTCHRCKINFKNPDALRRHNVDVHREGFVCNICDFVFAKEVRLVVHQRQTHMKEKNVKCAHCKFEAFHKAVLAKHMRVHYNIRTHECRICKKKFKNSSNRNCHERIHTGDKRKVCQLCGEKFVQRASLKYHLEKYHPGDAY